MAAPRPGLTCFRLSCRDLTAQQRHSCCAGDDRFKLASEAGRALEHSAAEAQPLKVRFGKAADFSRGRKQSEACSRVQKRSRTRPLQAGVHRWTASTEQAPGAERVSHARQLRASLRFEIVWDGELRPLRSADLETIFTAGTLANLS